MCGFDGDCSIRQFTLGEIKSKYAGREEFLGSIQVAAGLLNIEVARAVANKHKILLVGFEVHPNDVAAQ